MFAKTFRSAVSLLLVCCLLLGASGNAAVLAAENPVSGAIDKVDNKVESVIAELEAAIADLEAEVEKQEQNLADAEDQLNTGKEDLADAQATLDKKKELLDDAKAELDKLQGKLDEADEMLGKLNDKVAEYQAQLDDAQVKLDDAQVKLDDAQVQLDNAKAQLLEAQAQLAEKEAELNDAWDLLTEKEAELKKAQDDFEEAMSEFLKLEAEVREMPEGPEKEAAQKELDKLGAEVSKANDEVDAAWEKINDAKAQLEDATQQLNKAKKQLTDAEKLLTEKQAEKDDAQALKDQYQADKNDYQDKLDDAKVQLADAEDQVDWAKGEYDKLYDTIDEIEGTIDDYQDKIDEINEAVEEAEEALPTAETALEEANEALAAAKTVVENIKATYATLYNAVSDPTASVAFVKETVTTLYDQTQDLWASVLDLQDALHELIAAYEELADFAIDPIVIDDYYFEGLVIEPFEVGEYHYEEVGFHFNGYKFDGYTVDPVTVEGYSFEGFTAPAMPEELTKISNALDTVIAKTVTTVNAVKYYGGIILNKLGVAVDAVVDFAKNHLNKQGAVKVYNWLYNNPDKVCGLVKEFGIHGLDLLVTYGPYALDLLDNHSDLVVLGLKATAGATYLAATLGAKLLGYLGDKLDFLADYKDDVAMAAAKLYAKYGDEAKALVKVYVDYLQLEERYYNATNGVYVIGGPNLYVALGDDSSESVSYVDKLAEALGVPYENLADHDLSVEEAVQANLETLKKADLITIGYSANTAAKNAIERLQNYMMAEPIEDIDWTTLVGDKYDGQIVLALEKFENALIAAGLDGEYYPDYTYVDMIMVAAEAYLCEYLNYILDSRNAVNSIQAVNDDALIVLVGMYNPYEGVTITNGDKSVDLGELYDLLIEAVDCYYLAYAFVNENTIFVNAPAVETNVEAGSYDLYEYFADLLLNDTTNMDATDAGHEYIKNQILDALTVKMLGDVNTDGKVNNVDAMLILQYATDYIGADDLDLDVADVNFDDKYNNCDALQILRYITDYITEFAPREDC